MYKPQPLECICIHNPSNFHKALQQPIASFLTSFLSRKPSVTENTIASLKQAGAHGADYVEFDVQLTKDLQLVVYHDFRVVTTLAKQGFFSGELYEMLVKDLTLSQLQSLKLEHSSVLSQHNRHLNLPEGVRSASQSSGGETSHDSDSSLETYWGTGYKEDLPERKTFPLLKLVCESIKKAIFETWTSTFY